MKLPVIGSNAIECYGFCNFKSVVVERFRRREKGKAIPLQAWTGPEDSRRMRLTDFKTIGT